MQKVFRIWIICIFILALIAAFLVDFESIFFGFILLPMIIILAIIIILGFLRK